MTLTTLHLCTSDSWGGLELYTAALVMELQTSGVRTVTICKPRSPLDRYLRARGMDCEYLPSYLPWSISAVSKLHYLIRLYGAGVLHVHFHRDIWPASFALRRDHVRRLFLSIYMGVPAKNDFLHRYVYGRVDGIFTSSEELNRRLPALYPVPGEKIHFLPYGRRLDRYVIDTGRRNEIRAKLGLADDELLAGTMVRIDPGKGVMDFAQSILYLDEGERKKVRYIIIGEPTRRGRVKEGESPYEPACEAYLKNIQAFIREHRLEERVLLAGFQQDTVGYLSAMDFFVFPSRDELYSLVMLDAMALGLPIVAARSGGNIAQVREDMSGLLYTVADSRDLAAKLRVYINDPALRIRHGNAAKEFVRSHHDMNNTIKSLLDFYHG